MRIVFIFPVLMLVLSGCSQQPGEETSQEKVQNIFKEANITPSSVELESTASLLDECSINGRKAKAEGQSISDVISKANKDTDTALAGFNSVMNSKGMSKKPEGKKAEELLRLTLLACTETEIQAYRTSVVSTNNPVRGKP